MTERATLLGGGVDFSRRDGGGTTVTARVPLATPAEAT
jgi:signal transduction histidine kinase